MLTRAGEGRRRQPVLDAPSRVVPIPGKGHESSAGRGRWGRAFSEGELGVPLRRDNPLHCRIDGRVLSGRLYTVFGTRLSNNYSASSPVYALTYDLNFARVSDTAKQQPGDVFAVFLLIYFGFLLLAGRQGPGLFRALRAATPAATRPSSRTRCPR